MANASREKNTCIKLQATIRARGKKCLVGEEGINEIKLLLRATVSSRIKAET